MANIISNLMGGMTADKLSATFKDVLSSSKGISDNLQKASKFASGLGTSMKSMGSSALGIGQKMLGSGSTGNMLNNALGSFANAPSAGASMTNAFGSGQGSLEDALRKVLVPDKTDTGLMFSGVMSGMQQFMPDVKATIGRATGYYNATMSSGNRFPRATSGLQAMYGMPSVEDMTFKTLSGTGGMTSVGSDATVAKYLTGRGMSVSGQYNSTYQQTLRTIGNAGKYLNISNEAAAASVENLTSAQGSSNMLRKFGIYTSDLTTGKEKTQSQIFEELAQRFTAGHEPMSIQQTQADIRRGFLGVNIQSAFGNDQAGAEMFKQYMIDRAGGTKMDLSNQSAMDKIYGSLGNSIGGAQGNENPMNALNQLNASDTAQLDKSEQSYLAGINAAVPALTALNEAAGLLTQTIGGVTNGFMTMFQGSKTAQGLGKAASSYVDWSNANYAKMASDALPYLISGNYVGAMAASAPSIANLSAGNILLAGTAAASAVSTVVTGGLNPSNVAPVNQKSNPTGKDEPYYGGDFSDSLNSGVSTVSSAPMSPSTPVKGGGFNDPAYKKKFGHMHHGVDYKAADNTNVYSVSEGTATIRGQGSKRLWAGSGTPPGGGQYDGKAGKDNNGNLGLHVTVAHPSGYTFWYCHLSSVSSKIKKNSQVSKAQLIGQSGHTGATTGAHLHFAVSDKNGTWVDPKTAIAKINGTTAGAPASSGSAGTSAVSSSAIQSGLNNLSASASSQLTAGFFGASPAQITSIFQKLSSGNMQSMQEAVSMMTALSKAAGGGTSSTTTKGTTSSTTGDKVVNVNLTLPDVSETEAAKFAKLVKQYLENDTLTSNMGSY
jgi:murein DD-endopeptidase MepM/ murein hydrolase activator NlpD